MNRPGKAAALLVEGGQLGVGDLDPDLVVALPHLDSVLSDFSVRVASHPAVAACVATYLAPLPPLVGAFRDRANVGGSP
jgi:hypothetical protein